MHDKNRSKIDYMIKFVPCMVIALFICLFFNLKSDHEINAYAQWNFVKIISSIYFFD